MRTAMITVTAGRHDHLRRQHEGVLAGSERPQLYLVVAMGDPALSGVVAGWSGRPQVVDLPAHGDRLPLARARNVGAEHAIEAGVDLLIFLDVDCIPGPDLVRRYRQTACEVVEPSLLCGPVSYLPPPPPGGYPAQDLQLLADPHPVRPAPTHDQVLRQGDHRLFWSLSFAVRTPVWQRIGGFCERYEGYGGEDTDFGQLAHEAGIELVWVGGASAFHQHHPVQDPPVGHLRDILRNATLFHSRWGWWPMTGWLERFERDGLAYYDTALDRWLAADAG
ncbi:glycosyltransferase family 2 protein [Pseudonocardiaceae bacterium YIM PH 21723]|nr:glycosyltransferase family 2 protein [Pseudonocardiaceae bacterium YIM PH 21723]